MEIFKQIRLNNLDSNNPFFICGDHYNKKCGIAGEIACTNKCTDCEFQDGQVHREDLLIDTIIFLANL